MKVNFIFLAITFVLLINCTSFKRGMVPSGGRNEIINNAIKDFSENSTIFKHSNVFSIKTENENKDIAIVRIGKSNTKLLVNNNTKIGSKGILPSKFIEIDSRLFYWWDDSVSLTQEALDTYYRYGIVQYDKSNTIVVPDFIIDEDQKSAHYYFCRNYIKRYQKVITNRAIGTYDPPKLNCNP